MVFIIIQTSAAFVQQRKSRPTQNKTSTNSSRN
uniref:Uncharacterized protein n=1 Tax=Rhizophora mucronata TaxID=61149 RepID=A0A2P2Q2N1_RHIMU